MIDNQQSIPLCSGTTIADSLRATGFNNSAYALSELIDNSVEAGARNIYICVFLDKDKSIAKIAVLDDGDGIDFGNLQRCLQYGSGTRTNIDKKKRKLGRFGVGLTQSTFSQCEKLDVWSWQEGFTNSYKAFCHLPAKGEENQQIEIAPAEEMPLPDDCEFMFSEFPEHKDKVSGTLVLWDGIRDLTWKKYTTLFEHIEMEVGRIFRTFISDKRLNIRMIARDLENGNTVDSISVKALDPLFLHKFDGKDLRFKGQVAFEALNPAQTMNEDGSAKPINILVTDEKSLLMEGVSDDQANVRIYVTHRKKEIVELCDGQEPGSTELGKLAEKLRGVSIMRHGRELRLDNKWLKDNSPTDRWIGICIDFDPSLDEIFGVSNNKQDAQHLSKLATKTLKELNDEEEKSAMHRIAIEIKLQIKECKRKIDDQRKGARSPTQDSIDTSHAREMSDKTEMRAQNHSIDNDTKNPKEHEEVIRDSFVNLHVAEEAREKNLSLIIREGLRVSFASSATTDSAHIFNFSVEGGTITIVLNEKHPMYEKLRSHIFPDEDLSDKEKERLQQTGNVIKTLICSYARAEAEAQGREKDEFEAVRFKWGMLAKHYFSTEEE